MMSKSNHAKGVILWFIASSDVGPVIVDERREAGFHNLVTLRLKALNIPAKPRQSANECQAGYRACILSRRFFQVYKLSRSQNGFGVAVLLELARRVNGHLGAISRRHRRDPRHQLPAKHDED